jgi:glycosyltransferase involved in cell wall biosynthesis
LTVPVGNSDEIIKWTNGGILCPATIDKNGRTNVDPKILAKEIEKLINDPSKREQLSKNGKKKWQEGLTWHKITLEYEKVLKGN